MSYSIINTWMYMYYYIVYSFFRICFILGFYVQEKKKESFLDMDHHYIQPLKTKFLKTFENQTILYNENIEAVFYDKKAFSNCLLDANNRLETVWKARIIFENTPRGNIIMFYDAYKLGFSFYSDQKVISYDILNAAAMKYVSIFRCRDFFIDDSITPTSSPFIKMHFTDEPKKETSKSEKSAFVKLQNYTKDHPNRHPFQKSMIPLEKSSTIASNEPEKMKNKFVYLGKVNNFKMTQFAPKKRKVLASFSSPLLDNINCNVQRECLSYKDFKKSMSELTSVAVASSDS